MSVLNSGGTSIYEAMQYIKSGKYVMPAFQRQFVWSMEQIEKLWDSILLDYPIANFLFWHVDADNVTPDTYFCNFLDEVTFDSRKQSDSKNYETSGINLSITDTGILDGQQRLTSLYLSLYGGSYIRQKYARTKYRGGTVAQLLIELNKNRLEVDEEEYNSKKYDIRFSVKIGQLSPTQFEVRKILADKFRNADTRDDAIEVAISKVPPDSKEYAQDTLKKLCAKVFDEALINYTEIFDMKQDDALEMFVRFNAGGRPLRKHEITMSILEAYWPNAKASFGSLLTGSYAEFGTDFIVRTALMLYGDVVKSNISKKIADDLHNNWNAFSQTLVDLESLLKEFKIDVGRFSSSWNVLLPIIYVIYYNPEYMDCADGIKAYLHRAILFTYFQSGTTSKLQQMKSNINSYDFEITIDMLEQMNELRVTEGKIDDIVNSEKGSRIAGDALYFLSLDWINPRLKYAQDHLHPYERFNRGNPASVPTTTWRQWYANRNRLPNIWLLEGSVNSAKGDMPLLDYYNEKTDSQKEEFRRQAIIPEGVSLEIDAFGDFYEKRKELITKKIRELLM